MGSVGSLKSIVKRVKSCLIFTDVGSPKGERWVAGYWLLAGGGSCEVKEARNIALFEFVDIVK